MNDRLIGVGIYLFILSVNLIFSGTLITRQASPDPFYSMEKGWQEEDLVESAEIDLQEGILRAQRESTEEIHQAGRKFPLAPALLFLLFSPYPEEKPELLSSYALPFFNKDLPVAYRSLRI